MRSREARDLSALIAQLRKASPNARVDRVLDQADDSLAALDAKLSAAREEARTEALRRERERWDAEKAYQDGYAQGMADGYGQALEWVAEGCHG